MNRPKCPKCGYEMTLFPVYPDKDYLEAVQKGDMTKDPYPREKAYWLCLRCTFRRKVEPNEEVIA